MIVDHSIKSVLVFRSHFRSSRSDLRSQVSNHRETLLQGTFRKQCSRAMTYDYVGLRKIIFAVCACVSVSLSWASYAFFAPFFQLHAAEFSLDTNDVGLVFSAFAFAQLLSSPFAQAVLMFSFACFDMVIAAFLIWSNTQNSRRHLQGNETGSNYYYFPVLFDCVPAYWEDMLKWLQEVVLLYHAMVFGDYGALFACGCLFINLHFRHCHCRPLCMCVNAYCFSAWGILGMLLGTTLAYLSPLLSKKKRRITSSADCEEWPALNASIEQVVQVRNECGDLHPRTFRDVDDSEELQLPLVEAGEVADRITCSRLSCDLFSTALLRGAKVVENVDKPLPRNMQKLLAQHLQCVQTNGDGACSLHSVFGALRKGMYGKGELYLSDARSFLRSTLTTDVQMFRLRLNDDEVYAQLQQTLWKELVKPCAWKAAGLADNERQAEILAEGETLWELVSADNALSSMCITWLRQQRALHGLYEDQKAVVVKAFGAVCLQSLGESFVRPLLASIGIFDGFHGEVAYHTNRHDGMKYVRGTQDVLFPLDGPASKYDALFDLRPQFDVLRKAVVESLGSTSLKFKIFHSKVIDTIESMREEVGAMDALVNFSECVLRLCNLSQPTDEAFPGFFEEMYPFYVEALQSNGYFLSDIELLAVCQCARVNVIILAQQAFSFRYIRHTVCDPQRGYVVTAVRSNERGKVRSHFERVVCDGDGQACVMQLRKLVDALERERCGFSQADAEAQSMRSYLLSLVVSACREKEVATSEELVGTVMSDSVRVDRRVEYETASVVKFVSENATRAAVNLAVDGLASEVHNEGSIVAVTAHVCASRQAQSSIARISSQCMKDLLNQAPHMSVAVLDEDVDAVDLSEPARGIETRETPCAFAKNASLGIEDLLNYSPYMTSIDEGAELQTEDLYKSAAREEASSRKIEAALLIFNVKVATSRERKPEADLLLDAAARVAEASLRKHVTLPADPSEYTFSLAACDSGMWMPPVSCAFQDCTWCVLPGTEAWRSNRDHCEHPWDVLLREHVLEQHGEIMLGLVNQGMAAFLPRDKLWDVYKAALSIQERRGVPIVGASVDRRVFEYTRRVYHDDNVRSLVCFACAQIKVDTGGKRSDVEFCTGRWLFSLPPGSLVKNFSMAEFTHRYRKGGSPLAHRSASSQGDVRTADFYDWTLKVHPQYVERLAMHIDGLDNKIRFSEVEMLRSEGFLCCPEDQCCKHSCVEEKMLCPDCAFPLCRTCRVTLHANQIIPQALINDNWYGYVDEWIFNMGITWMEKTVSTPYWTGITLFSVGTRGSGGEKERRQHLLQNASYASKRRTAFKGQLFSAPMDWSNVIEQLVQIDKKQTRIALPVSGSLLQARVAISITSGLVNLNKCLREATIRRDVVVQLIRMRRDSGHPDFQGIDMAGVEVRAREMASSNDPTIPEGLQDALEESSDEELDDFVDKAATPAERLWSEEQLIRDMNRMKPLYLMAQRDSDACKEVEASRKSAFAEVSELRIKTGSVLLDQFQSVYIPRVFSLTLPWCVGGPDFRGRPRFRRHFEDASIVTLDSFTSMMSRRVESQIKWDWDFNPGLWSLSFASKVNLGMSMSLNRCMRRATEAEVCTDHDIGKAAVRLLTLLEHGEYEQAGRRLKIRGDISKLAFAKGLRAQEDMLLRNYHFMAGRLAGTRQVRKRINHMVFSTRIILLSLSRSRHRDMVFV